MGTTHTLISEALLNKLKLLCQKKKPITIRGINSYGKHFEVTAPILLASGSEKNLSVEMITPWGLTLDFGALPGTQRLTCPIRFDFYNLHSMMALEILNDKGALLYQNENAKTFLEAAAKNATREQNAGYLTYEASWQNDYNLHNYLGKPVLINGACGILINFDARRFHFHDGKEICNGFWKTAENKVYTFEAGNLKPVFEELEQAM